MKKYINLILYFIINFLIFSTIAYIIFSKIEDVINFVSNSNLNLFSNVESTSSVSTNTAQTSDPVRWWPSGTPQSWGIIGAAIATYRAIPGSPRAKSLAAFSSLGVTIPTAVFTMAVENPNGFNRLMYSWIQYNKTNVWPADIPKNVSDVTIDKTFETASSSKVSDHLNRFIGDGSDIFENFNTILNTYINNFLSIFKIHHIEGYFDDLYGFIWFCQILLFIISISVLILFLIHSIIMLFTINKDYFINKFSDKNIIIKYYLKYQIILGKISFYWLSFLIILGLISLIQIQFYLITHPLPIDNIGIDPHIWINKSK
jgi:hypothetical protein